MFVQIIEGRTNDADAMRRKGEEWLEKLRPGAVGFVGVTAGATADGRAISIVRFDSAESAKANGVSGKGASYGPVYALGGMFLLDVLDEDDAKSADGITGINNSYVFLEWTRTQLDGFGSSDVLDIGSSSWTLGVAVEM